MMRVAVIDSSPLINLAHIDLASKLAFYFTGIYVPRKVQEEVNKKSRFRHRLNKLYRMGFYQRCSCADEYRVRLLRFEQLDAGESEGLVQAQEKGAQFFIADEKRARAIAEKQGLTPVGTVRLLARLSLEGYAPGTQSLVQKLKRDLGFRIDEQTVTQAIAEAIRPI